MALSDEERRRLEKLEQELAASDPDLDRELQSGLARSRFEARKVYGVLVTFAGFALIIVAIMTDLTVIGAVGFLMMIAGADWFLRGIRLWDKSGEPPTER